MTRKKYKRYTHPIVSREVIAEFISHQKTAIPLDLIASNFSYSEKRDLEALKKRVLAMVRDGQIKERGIDWFKVKFSFESS